MKVYSIDPSTGDVSAIEIDGPADQHIQGVPEGYVGMLTIRADDGPLMGFIPWPQDGREDGRHGG